MKKTTFFAIVMLIVGIVAAWMHLMINLILILTCILTIICIASVIEYKKGQKS